jgi:DNA-binding transcriptional MocR family regulator
VAQPLEHHGCWLLENDTFGELSFAPRKPRCVTWSTLSG